MPLHPQAQAFVDTINALDRPPLSEMTVEMARAGLRGLLPPSDEKVGAIADFELPGADGQPVRARAYTPRDARPGPLPLVMFLHGGGWIGGDLESHDATCRALANASGCKVVAIDYRLAPEHKFPAGLNDCYAALQWLAVHASALGADPGRIAVCGDSAGGNLAASVAIMARDRGGPALAFQVLVYPVTHHAFDTPSYREYGQGYLLTLEGMQWNWNHYLPDPAAGRDPLASPLLAPDLRSLPPALVIVAECDPLCDEGEAYARRLAEAGVAVECRRYDGMLHAFFTLGQVFDDGRASVAHAGAALRRALA
ncbi:alpha/beta hydrolase [Scleromatobacter humisilvae]|uniref:Alpha/beta hydrolase n=1 Tax=Scleromatobacter humisilvae TaxID=2897159 RepID=A0A9X1YR38_9BURK|nr:alpha/beta hydrolase [Scleromatobacter humisilvae]MCK9686736.1 alpha/beta hydrolase [Scleromatobacter humisilvae]